MPIYLLAWWWRWWWWWTIVYEYTRKLLISRWSTFVLRPPKANAIELHSGDLTVIWPNTEKSIHNFCYLAQDNSSHQSKQFALVYDANLLPNTYALNKEQRFPACLNPCSPFLLYLLPGSPTFCAVFSPRPSIPSSVSLSSEFSSPGKGSRLALHRHGRAQTHSSKGPPGVSSKQGKLPSFTLGIYVQHVWNESTAWRLSTTQ